jgi:hypothetical protein
VFHELVGDAADSAAPDAIRISITRDGRSYLARVAFARSPQGDRELTGDNCETLSSAALLVAALTVDPLAAADALAQTPVDVSSAAARPVHALLALRFQGDVGTLPFPTVGPGLEAGLEVGPLRVSAEAAVWLPQVKLRADRAGGRMALLEGAIRGCVDALRTARGGAGPCLGVAAGPYFGHGLGVMTRNHTLAPWLAGTLGISAHQHAGSIALEASAQVGLTLIGPTYSIGGEAFFQPRWFGRVTVGCGWRL